MKNDGKTVDSAEKALSGRNKTLFTTEQQTAIDADGKVLVSASAGSGKTTTMVEKILRCIEEGVSLADMLILVYNEAAAGELRDRLQSALFDAACTASFKERGKFRSCLDALSTAHIGTIHSFCYSLIKANFEKLGVSPACDVLSAGEAKRYDDLAMDEVFARYYAEGDEVFMRLADVLTRSRREDELRKVVEKVYAVIAIQPDRQAFARKLCDGFDGALDSEYAEAALAFMRRDVSRVREGLELSAPVYAAGGYPLYAEKMRLLAELCAEAEGADVAAMGRLAEKYPNIVGCKDTMSGMDHTREIIKRIKPVRPDFKVYSGFDDNFGYNVMSGGDGCIGGLSNVLPGFFKEWMDAFEREDAAALSAKQQEINRLMDIYSVGTPFVPYIKAAMKALGIIRCARASFPLPSADERDVERLLEILKGHVR